MGQSTRENTSTWATVPSNDGNLSTLPERSRAVAWTRFGETKAGFSSTSESAQDIKITVAISDTESRWMKMIRFNNEYSWQ